MYYKQIKILKEEQDKKVYLIQEYKTNLLFILKESKREENLITEHRIMNEIKEMIDIKYLEFKKNGQSSFLIYDYKEGMNLEEFINHIEGKSQQLTEVYFEYIVINLLYQIHKLHKFNDTIIHRDIKPRNIIIDSKYHPYIIDFSAAIMIKNTDLNFIKTSEYGTIGFSAPEQFTYMLQDVRTDIYGIGQTMKYVFPSVIFKTTKIRKKWIQIMNKCTQQNINHRYNSVEKIIEEVNQLHNGNCIMIHKIICK